MNAIGDSKLAIFMDSFKNIFDSFLSTNIKEKT